MSTETREELQFIPAQFTSIEHMRHVYCCRHTAMDSNFHADDMGLLSVADPQIAILKWIRCWLRNTLLLLRCGPCGQYARSAFVHKSTAAHAATVGSVSEP
jgi:hypothetical protein